MKTLRHFANFVAKHYQISTGGYIDNPAGDFAMDFERDLDCWPEKAKPAATLANLLALLPSDVGVEVIAAALTCWQAYCTAYGPPALPAAPRADGNPVTFAQWCTDGCLSHPVPPLTDEEMAELLEYGAGEAHFIWLFRIVLPIAAAMETMDAPVRNTESDLAQFIFDHFYGNSHALPIDLPELYANFHWQWSSYERYCERCVTTTTGEA